MNFNILNARICLLISLLVNLTSISQSIPLIKEQISDFGGGGLYQKSLIVDFDNDGFKDLVYGRESEILWFKNNGNNTFSTSEVIANGGYGVQKVLMGDLNGDGLDDIVSANDGDGSIMRFMNLGSMTYSNGIAISSTFPGVNHVDIFDVNNDGLLDVIGADYGGSNIVWFENVGAGNFNSGTVISDQLVGLRVVTIGDIDQDGDLDVFSGSADQTLKLFENLGMGVFGPEIIIETQISPINDICIGDVNFDGTLDLVTASQDYNWWECEIRSIINNGNGTFTPSVLITNSLRNPKSISFIDYNDDGADDLFIDSKGTTIPNFPGWYVCISDSAGSYSTPFENFSYPSGYGGSNILYNDMDNDSDIDVIIGNEYYTNDGSWNYALTYNPFAEFVSARDFHSVDFEGDGDLDILFFADQHHMPSSEKVLACFLNDGLGNFNSYEILDDTINILDLDVGDVNGDGILDIVYLDGGAIYWRENIGLGQYSSPSLLPNGIASFSSFELSDIDGDSDIDILGTAKNSDVVAWCENSNAIFLTWHIISDTINIPQQSKPLDVNQDGITDFVVFSSNVGGLYLYEGLGGGTFSNPQEIDPTSMTYFDLRVDDLNNDGLEDLLLSGYSDDKIVYYKNLGGVFDLADTLYDNMSYARIETTDIDGDNDKDIICSDNNLGIVWLENFGSGVFSPSTNAVISTKSGYFSVEDFDGDGDVDIVSTGVFLYRNELNYRTRVSGNTFVDLNQNNLFDSLDLLVPEVVVSSSPNSGHAFSNFDGYYLMDFFDSSQISIISPTIPNNWSLVTDSLFYTITVDSTFQERDSLNFGIYPSSFSDSIRCELTGGFPRCNNEINYWINLFNEGTTVVTGIIELELDNTINFISSTPAPDSIVLNSVYWSYDSLLYFQNLGIELIVLMPDFNSSGDTLFSNLNSIVLDSIGNIIYSSQDGIEPVLVCGYDPNDKKNEPKGIDEEGYISPDTEYIDYTIRFQNTGNDTVFNIVIVDQLDSNLAWNSVINLASSYQTTSSVSESGELVFTLNNIMLPDSNVNNLGSQGFVKYRVFLLPNLPPETTFLNEANIYFDFNPPILTNFTVNTLYDCNDLFNGIESLSNSICYNEAVLFEPELSTTYLSWSSIVDSGSGNAFGWLASIAGLHNVDFNFSNSFCSADTSIQIMVFSQPQLIHMDSLTICQGDSISIFGAYEVTSASYVDTVIGSNGCDSLIGVFLNVLDPPLVLFDTLSVCNGDSVLLFSSYEQIAGFYYDTVSTLLGCDSIIGQYLEVLPNIFESLNTVSFCAGDSILVSQGYVSIPGIYYDTLQAFNGCDSIVAQEVLEDPTPVVTLADFYFDSVCPYNQPMVLPLGTPVGGIFSGSGISGNHFFPADSLLGLNTVYYTITNNFGCSGTDSSATFVDQCLGLLQLNSSQISVYPNPSSDYTIIYFGNLNPDFEVHIQDLTGKNISIEYEGFEDRIEIVTKGIKDGIYMLSLTDSYNAEFIYSTRLIIQHD